MEVDKAAMVFFLDHSFTFERVDMAQIDLALVSTVRLWCSSGRARRIREDAQLNMSELGRLVGTSGATVSRWEDGIRRPAGARAMRYYSALVQLSGIADASPQGH